MATGLKAERKPPRSSKSASYWELRCRARVYQHGGKHLDAQRRKILLFKNKQQKKTFLSWESVFLTHPVIIHRWGVFFAEENFLPIP